MSWKIHQHSHIHAHVWQIGSEYGEHIGCYFEMGEKEIKIKSNVKQNHAFNRINWFCLHKWSKKRCFCRAQSSSECGLLIVSAHDSLFALQCIDPWDTHTAHSHNSSAIFPINFCLEFNHRFERISLDVGSFVSIWFCAIRNVGNETVTFILWCGGVFFIIRDEGRWHYEVSIIVSSDSTTATTCVAVFCSHSLNTWGEKCRALNYSKSIKWNQHHAHTRTLTSAHRPT